MTLFLGKSDRWCRAGNLVRVRQLEDIVQTLDENGTLDGMPFMPEMAAYCGKRLRVSKTAHKTCDTIYFRGGRRLGATVHLEDTRCDGSAHAGCQARCRFFWKIEWLQPVSKKDASQPVTAPAQDPELAERLRATAIVSRTPEIIYRCQATEVLRSTTPLPWWDLRQYVQDLFSGNVGWREVVEVLAVRVLRHTLRLGAYRAQLKVFEKVQRAHGGLVRAFPFQYGKLEKTPRETLDLQPGDHVRVKSFDTILKTLDKRNRNRGLSFDPEMVRYCGGTFQVLDRVNRLIDEKTGQLVQVRNDCIMLDAVVCTARYSPGRYFCPRAVYPYWREIWLDKVGMAADEPAS
jgi:hypothetical protein